jgi:hypothetical protein
MKISLFSCPGTHREHIARVEVFRFMRSISQEGSIQDEVFQEKEKGQGEDFFNQPEFFEIVPAMLRYLSFRLSYILIY